MSSVFVVCPGDLVTGGPELLHQLVDALNNAGGDAAMIYYPFDRVFSVPDPYRAYNVTVARREDIPAGARVVLPETLTALVGAFGHAKVLLWWLSVDNFRTALGSARAKRFVPAALMPFARRMLARLPVARRLLAAAGSAGGIDPLRAVHLHLHQSEFARQYLAAHGLGPTAPLGDYINDEYLESIARPFTTPREDILTYNPAKGVAQTTAILAELERRDAAVRAVPIKGLSREGVRDLLSRAKLYIDFGNHPGKDRIPREAAAMGTCIIVNRRGSAANDIDVPIPEDCKVDDEQPGFVADAVGKILAVMSQYDRFHDLLEQYRAQIAQEHDQFNGQVRSVFL